LVSFSKRPPKMKTCKCFQHWSYFSCDLSVCEIHKSNFNTSPISRWPTCFLKYMKVILTLVLFSSDLLVCEIHESDFNIGLIFQVTYHFIKKNMKVFQHWSYCNGDLSNYEIHESDFNNGLIFQMTYLFVKYMKVISTLVLFSRWPTQLWNKWKWFQHWSYFHGQPTHWWKIQRFFRLI
jgi:hypothetical protein